MTRLIAVFTFVLSLIVASFASAADIAVIPYGTSIIFSGTPVDFPEGSTAGAVTWKVPGGGDPSIVTCYIQAEGGVPPHKYFTFNPNTTYYSGKPTLQTGYTNHNLDMSKTSGTNVFYELVAKNTYVKKFTLSSCNKCTTTKIKKGEVEEEETTCSYALPHDFFAALRAQGHNYGFTQYRNQSIPAASASTPQYIDFKRYAPAKDTPKEIEI